MKPADATKLPREALMIRGMVSALPNSAEIFARTDKYTEAMRTMAEEDKLAFIMAGLTVIQDVVEDKS